MVEVVTPLVLTSHELTSLGVPETKTAKQFISAPADGFKLESHVGVSPDDAETDVAVATPETDVAFSDAADVEIEPGMLMRTEPVSSFFVQADVNIASDAIVRKTIRRGFLCANVALSMQTFRHFPSNC